jgi:hypothetical protein
MFLPISADDEEFDGKDLHGTTLSVWSVKKSVAESELSKQLTFCFLILIRRLRPGSAQTDW